MGSLLSVVLAAVVSMIVGALWYSPLLFGNVWMKLTNFSKKDIEKAKKKGMGKTYALMFVSQLVTAFALSYLLTMTEITTIAGGVQLAALVWIGFYATVILGSVLWEGKPFKLYLLNIVHWLVVLEVMSIILMLMR